jgi:hypothetical protein
VGSFERRTKVYVWPAGEELRIYLSWDEDLSHFLVGDSASNRLGRSRGAAMHTAAYSASSLAESQSVVRTFINRTSIFKWRSVVLSYIWTARNTQRQLAEAGDKIYPVLCLDIRVKCDLYARKAATMRWK